MKEKKKKGMELENVMSKTIQMIVHRVTYAPIPLLTHPNKPYRLGLAESENPKSLKCPIFRFDFFYSSTAAAASPTSVSLSTGISIPMRRLLSNYGISD